MNTEITDNGAEEVRGWVCYDGTCAICRRESHRWQEVYARRGFHFVPLQSPSVSARLGLPTGTLPGEMKLVLAGGRVLSGVEALAALARQVWWLWPLGFLASLPLLHPWFAAAYRWLARKRYCFGGRCELPKATRSWSPHHRVAAFFEMP